MSDNHQNNLFQAAYQEGICYSHCRGKVKKSKHSFPLKQNLKLKHSAYKKKLVNDLG